MIGASMGIIISGTTPGFPTVIEPGSMVAGSTHLLFSDNAVYYARNGTTGSLDYSGTSARTVIQAVLDNMNSDGGKITFIGTFYVDGNISVTKSHITFAGLGAGHEIVAQGGPSIIKKMDGAFNLFDIRGGGSGYVQECTFQDLTFFAGPDDSIGPLLKSGPSDALNFLKVQYVTIENCRFSGFLGSAVNASWTYGINIRGIVVTYCGDETLNRAAIKCVGLDNGDHRTTGIFISNSLVAQSAYIGIETGNNDPSCVIVDNYLEGPDGYNLTSSIRTGQYAHVIRNFCYNPDGIGIDVNGNWNYVFENTIMLAGGNGIDAEGGAKVEISNNFVDRAGADGIRAGNGSVISGNIIEAAQANAIYVNCARVIVDSNVLRGSNLNGAWPNSAIRLYSVAANCTITHNSIADDAPIKTVLRGVHLDTGVSNITIGENIFQGIATPIYKTASNKNVIIFANVGYITEMHGTTTITGAVNDVTVNHRLATTPTIVVVTVNNTGAGNHSVSSVTSTQFVISFTNQPGTSEWLFYWYAQA